MSNPVAIRYDFDGYGYQYIDSGSGSDWQTRVDGEPLYVHPAKTLTDEEIDAIENAVYCKTIQKGKTPHEYIMKFARAILKKASEK
jgi:hypothetical protein